MALDIVVLAGGRGRRLQTGAPKPLLQLAGESLIAHVLSAAMRLRPRRIVVVVPPKSDAIAEAARARFAAAEFAVQKQPRGTADAAMCGMQKLYENNAASKSNKNGAALESDKNGTALKSGESRNAALKSREDDAALILCADAPLLSAAVLRRLCKVGLSRLALLTFVAEDPAGYGRIVRKKNCVAAIVEERDARGEVRDVREVFAGALAAPAGWLKKNLSQVCKRARGKELYLTDLAEMAFGQNAAAAAVLADESAAAGVNTLSELAAAENVLRRRRALEMLAKGVRITDPMRVDFRGEVRAAAGAEIDVNVVLQNTSLARGAKVGAHCVLIDCKIGTDVRVEPFCHLHGAEIGARCVVGPFARIRPNVRLDAAAKVGNFVELKNARLGAGVKAGHLAYLGDAEVGANVNIGAGVITCNYDGRRKNKTVIGADSFIGSDAQLVAPVRVGRGAYIAAGTTLTKDAPPKTLTWSRVAQSSRPKKV